MDISAFRERNRLETISVSELNKRIKGLFDSSPYLATVSVCGEISNFKAHSSGHLYFSLKDAGGQIRAVMFKGSALRLRFVPENGMKVIVSGSVSVYERDGAYQLYANSMQPDGIGALYLAYEQLKGRLEAEGLFDAANKKSIPEFPEAVGVITSPTGAAVRDIINVISRRMPSVQIILYPALVQGDGAEESLIRALDYFESSRLVDTVIIGRGGGSIEDLWAFNGEKLARRIYSFSIPVISAVGHETDFTIADFVADLRAPTPSAAAELAVPDIRELILRIDSATERCALALERLSARYRERFESIIKSPVFLSPVDALSIYRDDVSSLEERCALAARNSLAAWENKFSALVGKLEALSPLSVLSRGYSVVYDNGEALVDAGAAKPGDELLLRLHRGCLNARVTAVCKEE